jgi:hypothetical protein
MNEMIHAEYLTKHSKISGGTRHSCYVQYGDGLLRAHETYWKDNTWEVIMPIRP